MLAFYEVVLLVCCAAWIRALKTLQAARRAGNLADVAVLRWMANGLGFSALSYLIRVLDASHRAFSLFAFVFGVAGTISLYAACVEYGRRTMSRRRSPSAVEAEPARYLLDADPGLRLDTRVSALTEEAFDALTAAYRIASAQCRCEVDPAHLLLGILEVKSGMGRRILRSIAVDPDTIYTALLQEYGAPARPSVSSAPALRLSAGGADLSRMTAQSREVIKLASMEAARFNVDAIGTDHLLLGLVLYGKGAAAHLLFRSGVTVDLLRDEIGKRRKPAVSSLDGS